MKHLITRTVQEMAGYQPGEQLAGSGVIKLNTNENPYPPSPRVTKILAGLSVESLKLYPDPVCRRLREIIAKLHKCVPEQVFCANGSDEVLALATRAFVEDNGAIGFFEPSYSLYPVLAQIRGARQQPVALGPDFGWQMPKVPACSLFFLANPNAPTGELFDKNKIKSFCRRFRGVVVLDEAYVDFARETCMDIALELPNVLAVRTLSKAYSLAGLRFGYAIGAAPIIEALYKIKDSYNVSRFTQEAAAAALLDQAWLRRNVRRIQATRSRMAKALQALGFSVHPSETNFLWVSPPAGASAVSIYQALRQRKILIRHFKGPRTSGHLRITVGSDPQVDALLTALKKMLLKGKNET